MKGLSRFIAFRDSLRAQLFEDSDSSVQNVTSSLAWNDSVYRTFNEGLRLAGRGRAKARVPMSLVDYVHRAHLAYVVVTLRKLYDDRRKGARAVNSLRSATKQIIDNQHLFNRENFVTFDGLPYEEKSGLDWKINYTVNWRHHFYDQLASLSSVSNRKRTDKIDNSVPLAIYNGTILRPEIEIFANKYLVHSAARNNRPDEQYAFKNITLTRIQLQYKNQAVEKPVSLKKIIVWRDSKM